MIAVKRTGETKGIEGASDGDSAIHADKGLKRLEARK